MPRQFSMRAINYDKAICAARLKSIALLKQSCPGSANLFPPVRCALPQILAPRQRCHAAFQLGHAHTAPSKTRDSPRAPIRSHGRVDRSTEKRTRVTRLPTRQMEAPSMPRRPSLHLQTKMLYWQLAQTTADVRRASVTDWAASQEKMMHYQQLRSQSPSPIATRQQDLTLHH